MSEAVAEVETDRDYRIITHHKADESGPVFIALAGMHGNESYGVAALRKVDEYLEKSGGILHGEWLGIAANLSALKNRVRFVHEDMNRIWFPSIVDKIRRSKPSQIESSERREIKSMLEIIDPYLSQKNREIVFVDLHSFSAPGGLFVITPRNSENQKKMAGLSVPLIFGIDDTLRGTALRYFYDQGHLSMAFEGGGHHETRTLYNMVSYLMLLSERFDLINPKAIDGYELFREQIQKEASHLPNRVELVYQHIIEPGDNFVMLPGFENFQPIKKGQWLADDRNGQIKSPEDGYMLMPLYQKQGNDGFFIVREV